MSAAERLKSPDGLRAIACSFLIGLLYTTGMRPSEALRLTDKDFDIRARTLHVRCSKFNKSRILPLGDDVAERIANYMACRDRLRLNYGIENLIVSTGGIALNLHPADFMFESIRDTLLQRGEAWTRQAPRLYDFRHSFACNTILRWHAEGVDVNVMMPHLATYLGHAGIADTYWYLTATPQLLDVACAAFHDEEAHDD
jgi:integrase